MSVLLLTHVNILPYSELQCVVVLAAHRFQVSPQENIEWCEIRNKGKIKLSNLQYYYMFFKNMCERILFSKL